MRNKILALLFVLFAFTACSQPISYYNSILLQQQNAAQDRAYLGIGGTNGSIGTVSNLSVSGLPPLFSASVSTPTTWPHVSFAPISQSAHTFYAAPIAGGTPVFRTIDASDLPGGGSGTVTSFSSGDLSPIFTTTVATPTTTPALSYNLTAQSANTVFAGPASGGSSAPTFRALVAGDIPSLSGTYLPLAGGTMSGTINLASGGINFGSSPMFQESANVVAIRNGTTAQTLEVYNTFTDASNYRRGFIGWSGSDLHIGTQSAGTGTSSGNLTIDVAGTHRITFRANSTDLWTILDPTAGGSILPLADNSYDIGDNTSPRQVRSIYVGTSVKVPTGQVAANQVLADNLSGQTGDNINMDGNIVLQDTSGAGNIQDKTGFTLVDSHGNFAGNGGGLTNIVLSITNASLNVNPTRITMIGSSNLPVPSIKSISAGTGTTITDQGTNIVISSNGSGGGSSTNSIDYYMTNLTSYANSSNYFIDFAFQSAVLTSATNVIAFNYSTNWGLANTSRVCNISIPPTNFGRIVTFTGLATNWHIQPSVYFIPLGYGARFACTQFGQGETNVTLNPFIDSIISSSNTTASFNPTNAFPSVGGLGTKLWLDASKGAFQDEKFSMPSIEGAVVRGWVDQSGFVTGVTNMSTTALNLTYHTPFLGPENVPCMSIYPGQSGAFCWLESPSFTALAAPTWGFVMYYGRSGGNCIDATAGTRFAINPAQVGQFSSFFCSSGIQYQSAPVMQWTLVACLGNGVSSVMRTNGVQAISGNAGSPTPSKWIVFGDNTHTTMVGSFNVAEILVLNTNLTATQLTNVESYFYRKYPFWNPPTVQ